MDAEIQVYTGRFNVPSIVLFISWGKIIQNNFLSKIQYIFYLPDECDIIIIHHGHRGTM